MFGGRVSLFPGKNPSNRGVPHFGPSPISPGYDSTSDVAVLEVLTPDRGFEKPEQAFGHRFRLFFQNSGFDSQKHTDVSSVYICIYIYIHIQICIHLLCPARSSKFLRVFRSGLWPGRLWLAQRTGCRERFTVAAWVRDCRVGLTDDVSNMQCHREFETACSFWGSLSSVPR